MGYAPKSWAQQLLLKTERKTYKCTFTVYKYVNPVSSAKVGKLTIKGTALKKNAIYNLRYSKYKNKSIAFKFNLKKVGNSEEELHMQEATGVQRRCRQMAAK